MIQFPNINQLQILYFLFIGEQIKRNKQKQCFLIGIINYGMQITIKEHNKAKNDQNIKCQFISLIIFKRIEE